MIFFGQEEGRVNPTLSFFARTTLLLRADSHFELLKKLHRHTIMFMTFVKHGEAVGINIEFALPLSRFIRL